MRRLVAALMLVAGMALTVVGIGSATWWKESPIVEASTTATSQSGVIATDPGVLELVDDTVRVTARAPGTEVEMVVASSDIAAIWLGSEPHVRVTGLADWTTLATEEPAEDVAPEGELTLQGSDLFHPENLIAAQDSAEFYFDVPAGDWTLIAIGQDGTTPQLTMSWEREVSTPWAIPLIILGVVVLAAGSALFLYDYQQRAVADRRAASRARSARGRTADSTDTTIMPALRRSRPSRSAATPPEDVRDDVRRQTGGGYGAGILPARSPMTEATEEHDESSDQAPAESALSIDDEPIIGDNGSEPAPQAEDPDPTEAESIDAAQAEDSLNTDETAPKDTGGTVGESTGQDDADTRASSAAWRSLWGFGPKE